MFHEEEIVKFLKLVKEKNVSQRIDGRSARNIHIFQNLAASLGSDKTPEQWRVKWKIMKTKYFEEKKRSSLPNEHPPTWQYYEYMDGLFDHRNADYSLDKKSMRRDREGSESDLERGDATYSSDETASERTHHHRAAKMFSSSRKRPALREANVTNEDFLNTVAEMMERSNRKLMAGLGNMISGSASDLQDRLPSNSSITTSRIKGSLGDDTATSSRKKSRTSSDADITNREFLTSMSEMMEKSNKQLITGFGDIVKDLTSTFFQPAQPQSVPSLSSHAPSHPAAHLPASMSTQAPALTPAPGLQYQPSTLHKPVPTAQPVSSFDTSTSYTKSIANL